MKKAFLILGVAICFWGQSAKAEIISVDGQALILPRDDHSVDIYCPGEGCCLEIYTASNSVLCNGEWYDLLGGTVAPDPKNPGTEVEVFHVTSRTEPGKE